MHELNGQMVSVSDQAQPVESKSQDEVVSTHVLVAEEKVEKLRELSRRTRVAQSEYLREAVDDLLTKYHKLEEDK
jgi:flagellar hook assembly protein FlgD